MARLLLKFQRQLDNVQIPNPASLLQALTGAPPAPGQAVPAPSTLNLQLWRMARLDCDLLQKLIPQGADLRRAPREGTLFPPDHCFHVTLTDEEERVNLNRLDAPQLSSQPTVMGLLSLFGDKRFEFLFEREDANRVKVPPQELVINLKDWVDEDEVQSTLNLSGQGEVFLPGFSDEGSQYDRYSPRYRPKNARFDTLDEAFMVHGVNDRFMAAFRDRLTVYPDINRSPNINTDDPLLLYMAILAVADPARPDPRLQNPLFVEQLIQQIRMARVFSFFGMGVADFARIVAASGVQVNQAILVGNAQNNRWVSDKSQTYRIQAVGEAGAVQKTLTAVIRLDDRLGTLQYWKEE
jgi:general secretion pathway protein K